jgi:23S rRNA (adenine1618-N6)-methyltransferase
VFDYTSWEGTRQLTATLLKADFGITWWLPEGQLVPTVTNRANYIHWINDLLALSAPQRASPAGESKEHMPLDSRAQGGRVQRNAGARQH